MSEFINPWLSDQVFYLSFNQIKALFHQIQIILIEFVDCVVLKLYSDNACDIDTSGNAFETLLKTEILNKYWNEYYKRNLTYTHISHL